MVITQLISGLHDEQFNAYNSAYTDHLSDNLY